MKNIYLNLKRFDVPRADGGVNDLAVWFGAEKQLELCEKADGKGYAYAENIRNSALKGGNADKVKKTVAEAVDFSYVVEAAKKVK